MVCLDAEYSTCRDTVSSSQFMVDGGADAMDFAREADLGQFSGSHKPQRERVGVHDREMY